MSSTESVAPTTSVEVRQRLVDALRLDLIGPWAGHRLSTERIPNYGGRTRPSNWYLTGFIVPSGAPPHPEVVAESDDNIEQATAKSIPGEEAGDDGKPARKGYFPASIGLSFRIDTGTRDLDVTVNWGDYVPEEHERKKVWRRIPHSKRLSIRIPREDRSWTVPVPESDGLVLQVLTRSIQRAHQSLEGIRSVSIFLINNRSPSKAGTVKADDQTYAFQPEIVVTSSHPLPAKSVAQGDMSEEWDDEVADLHYADSPEYATGHGVSADWDVVDGKCRLVRTAWIGKASVEHVKTTTVSGVEFSMRTLGQVADETAVRPILAPLVEGYRTWIEEQASTIADLANGKATAQQLLTFAQFAATRMERGINVLASDPNALDAFKVANRAVARALEQRLGIADPSWRAFQLAFILLNIPGLSNPKDKQREIVDLLFFPTGGGKTEAYLGLAAFAMVLRRLHHPAERGHAAGGVSVIMRYTLRLLTLDQLARAAGLVCALELERLEDESHYGSWPFEIGLWVGMAATPNRMGYKGDSRKGTARSRVSQFKRDPQNNPSPVPLEECPWCRQKFEPDSFQLLPNADRPTRLEITCTNLDCQFSDEPGLPIVSVDDSIYRRLPAFLIATVDKFASLPWTGESGLLLGGADRYDEDGFYGPAAPSCGAPLPSPLVSPDLIIQDELHLISGPLGTMAGLYEVAIEELCVRNSVTGAARPKIVASTATIRRAPDQVRALFGRSQTQVFPPPGPKRTDSFFANTVMDPRQARLYLGISAQGRNSKTVIRRVWVALMGAASKAFVEAGDDEVPDNPADPYMSVIGYFNSLRELGGGRRILEEEVQSTLRSIGAKRRHGESRGLFRDRKPFSEVLELTSRVPTHRVAMTRRRLDQPFRRKSKRGAVWPVDIAIATNMISVGLDIQRLGLMTVVGQPKTTAEYIQATSRVGRDTSKPGLVVTVLNIYRPRDRSHYERFKHFHQTFYRAVEVASVTPFSARALDRGLAGALVGLTRHALRPLTPPNGAASIKEERAGLEEILQQAFVDRARAQPNPSSGNGELDEHLKSVWGRIEELLDEWVEVNDRTEDSKPLLYQRYENPRMGEPLLRDLMDDSKDVLRRKFRAGRSLRDVETEVRLRLIGE